MSEPDIDTFLGAYAPDVAYTARWLIDLVLDEAPEAEVRVRPGWRLVGFTSRRYFCAVVPKDDHAELLFEQGARLPDPRGLLVRDWKQIAVVRVAAAGAVDEEALRGLIREALELAEAP